MKADIVDIRTFYATMLGRITERAIARAIGALWAPVAQERLLGLGYALPWLDRLGADAERVIAFMPARQGATPWPVGAPSATALVFEDELPLPDASMDRILVVHALEHAENPRDMLNELWRVLTPGGRVVIVVPNRRGVWARFEHTPFGTGRPYSRSQLQTLLRETNLTPSSWSEALMFPPSPRRAILRFHAILERIGRRFWRVFSGVHIVEAEKRIYQGLPVARRASRRVLVPVLTPQGASPA
jgi:SAM-dependent methyltransferase